MGFGGKWAQESLGLYLGDWYNAHWSTGIFFIRRCLLCVASMTNWGFEALCTWPTGSRGAQLLRGLACK